LLKDDDTNELVIAAFRGWTINYHMKGDRFKIGALGMVGHVGETGETYYAEKERMARELEKAQHVQLSLFPSQAPDLAGFEITGLCLPCQEVGGDWYDYIPLQDGRLALVLADVSGKGMGAALLMRLLIQPSEALSLPVPAISRRSSWMRLDRNFWRLIPDCPWAFEMFALPNTGLTCRREAVCCCIRTGLAKP
jgi:hypothetical protein